AAGAPGEALLNRRGQGGGGGGPHLGDDSDPPEFGRRRARPLHLVQFTREIRRETRHCRGPRRSATAPPRRRRGRARVRRPRPPGRRARESPPTARRRPAPPPRGPPRTEP